MAKFVEFDVDSNQVLGDETMRLLGMSAHPANSSKAIALYHKLLHGADGGADTLWKMDNNDDRKITATEWALFFVRVAGGQQTRFKQVCYDLRLYDVSCLMKMKRRGSLRDRYIALFDAIDANGDGFLDTNEMKQMVQVTEKMSFFDEVQQSELAAAQLNAVDKSGDGVIVLSEWLRYVQLRGELDEMLARNYHYFDRVFGGYNI
eukprot:TRINITY_DN13057_c0_g1_i3.p1 TRINITY_DN13057_c0_g1~~TRINITY_DN13057_c0_g1_i3.p1  ORF type:complete len:205 (-),score=48.72 TRINITY_DN13057_c0_g1_i3:283-897(-)